MGKMYKTIYETTDYSKFKKLHANRDPKTAQRIIKSINQVGYVLSPILVNEKFEVIDGQNRLEALKELNMPVHYMIQNGIGIKECRAMNTGQSNWTTLQYVESYAESGDESYIRLWRLMQDFGKKLTTEGVLFFTYPRLIPLSGGGIPYTLLKQGELELSQEEYERTRNDIEKVIAIGYYDFFKQYDMIARSWWAAVAYANMHKNVDLATLYRRIMKSPKEIVACARTVDQLAYLDDAYNKGRKPSGKVFMASDIQKGLYLTGGATC